MSHAPELNVVVYREPGPIDDDIDRHAAAFVEAKSPVPLGGGLGYLVLVPSDFDRLWGGVDAGDAFGTAASVLQFLGPSTRQFVVHRDDFIFGWVGDDKTDHGRILLLQIIPREPPSPHRPSLN